MLWIRYWSCFLDASALSTWFGGLFYHLCARIVYKKRLPSIALYKWSFAMYIDMVSSLQISLQIPLSVMNSALGRNNDDLAKNMIVNGSEIKVFLSSSALSACHIYIISGFTLIYRNVLTTAKKKVVTEKM